MGKAHFARVGDETQMNKLSLFKFRSAHSVLGITPRFFMRLDPVLFALIYRHQINKEYVMRDAMVNRKWYVLWLVLAPIFYWLSRYLAIFPHEYAHGLVASLFGFKSHFWQINYGGTSWWNLLFLVNIDEQINYAAMHMAGKDWLIALTAFAGSFVGNAITYAISLWLLGKESIRARAWLFYFCFWWNVNSIGAFIDYVPSRTFSTHADMANLANGLHVSPWWIMVVLGYAVIAVTWHFYRNTLLKAYVALGLVDRWAQTVLLLLVSFALLIISGTVGLAGYGELSHFVSLLCVWIALPVVLFCSPWRVWVRQRIKSPAFGVISAPPA
jgi:hypothetical protein